MPDGFKNLAGRADAADMSDTATPGSLDSFLLDGDAPRLGSAPLLPPAQPVVSGVPTLPTLPTPAPAAPSDAQVEMPTVVEAAPALPPLDALELAMPTLPTPSLPTPAAATSPATLDDPTAASPAEPRHPMAHLMPAKSQPNETSAWAAELRAKQKAKARRTKIIVAVVFLAAAALIGPPLGKWLVNAINESGSTKPDAPAATVPAAPATTAPAATATTPAPAPAPTTAPAGLLGLPARAEDAVAGVNSTAPAVAPAPAPATAAP